MKNDILTQMTTMTFSKGNIQKQKNDNKASLYITGMDHFLL